MDTSSVRKKEDIFQIVERCLNKLESQEPDNIYEIEEILQDESRLLEINSELEETTTEAKNNSEWEKAICFLKNLTEIFCLYSTNKKNSLKELPLEKLQQRIEILYDIFGSDQDSKIKLLLQRVQKLIESSRNEEFQRRLEDDVLLEQKIKALKLGYKESSIFPKKDELFGKTIPDEVLPHSSKGSYFTWLFYANNLFYFLKEDFFHGIRVALNNLNYSNFESRSQNIFDNVYIYDEVRVLGLAFRKKGTFLYLSLSPRKIEKRRTKIRWESTKRLVHGSLILICSKSLERMIFATVQEKPNAEIMNRTYRTSGFVNILVQIKTEDNQAFRFDDYKEIMSAAKDLLVIETKNYFEPYQHYLRRIQSLDFEALPFKNTIINSESDLILPPSYLEDSTKYKVTFNFQKSEVDKSVYRFNILGTWPQLEEKKLDRMQYNALKHILTKSISIIQGPPGTGKTYIGAIAVKILLENKYIDSRETDEDNSNENNDCDEENGKKPQNFDKLKERNDRKQIYSYGEVKTEDKVEKSKKKSLFKDSKKLNYEGPILVVCQTDHALDNFFTHVLNYTNEIVLVEGHSRSDELKYFFLSEKRKNHQYDGAYLKALNILNENVQRLDLEFNKLFDHLLEKIKKDFFDHYFKLDFEDYNKRAKCNYFINELDEEYTREMIEIWFNRDLKNLDNLKTELLQMMIGKKIIRETDPIFKDKRDRKPEYNEKQLRSYMKIPESLDWSKVIDKKSENIATKNENNDLLMEDDTDYDDIEDPDTEENRRKENNVSVNENDKKLLALLSVISDENLNILEAIVTNDDYFNCWRLPVWCVTLLKEYIIRSKTLEISAQRRNEFMAKHKVNCLDLENQELKHDLAILRKAKVIGMTITGCAKYFNYLDELGAEITIIEEAAEVLEAQNLCLLTPKLKHLILIGDHKQLRPKVYNFEFERTFNFNTSLFERLLKNKVEYVSLHVQRRMRPEIADFVRLLIHNYNYIDHPSVGNYENIRGMEKNIFFIQHNHRESDSKVPKIKYNNYEIEFVIALAEYLVKQGYKSTQVTIITFYPGQTFKLRAKINKKEILKDIVISTVDSYQGKENDIVILSLVRSNDQYEVGLIKESNRVFVAFSRAKMGLYVIGNYEYIGEYNENWKKVKELALKKQCLANRLKLVCQNHKKETIISDFADFKNCPQGGCLEICGAIKKCGHICKINCHNFDHNAVQCMEDVQEKLECGHLQNKKCHEKIKDCSEKVQKHFPVCGHAEGIPCSEKNPKCPHPFRKQLSCK